VNNYLFKGPFAEHIKNHIALKQAIGYKYEIETEQLTKFSAFAAKKYPDATNLTKEIILDWCSRKSYETKSSQSLRASIIRQLTNYLVSIGMNAYILPKGFYPAERNYVPYIYTENDLRRFIYEVDKSKYSKISQCGRSVLPLFFRMVYACGLRCSEARMLKIEDVDMQSGVITILHSKNDNSRLVCVSEKLREKCREYFDSVLKKLPGNDYFFPRIAGKPMSKGYVYRNFRHFLWKAGISHGGRGKGPRIHDFRHTFACHCLKKWVMQGKDLSAYFPVLKTYMGHNSFNETAYYLRMTADVFPDISISLNSCYPDIIPNPEGGVYETD